MRRPVLFLLLAVVLVSAGCRSSTPDALPGPPAEATTSSSSTSSTVRQTTTTAGPPRTTVTTVVTVGPGDASIRGTVTGPSGPVEGATVRVERLVGKSVATADVVSTGGGSWEMASILGGAYNVRAFKAPDLAPSKVESFFLAAAERKTIDFTLTAAGGDRITAEINPNPPRVGQAATLTVTVGIGRVDDQGRSVITPRGGVTLAVSPGPGYTLESPPQAVADGNGAAAWRLRCVAEGANKVTLTVGPGVTDIDLPPCGAPAAPAAAPTTRPG